MKRSLLVSLLILAAGCGLTVPPATPTPPPIPVPIDVVVPADPMPIIVRVYADLLKRQPDPYGIDYYGARLRSGEMDEAAMRAHVMQSAEYRALQTPAPPEAPPVITTPVEQIPPAVWVTIRQFIAAFPFPRGDGSDAYLQSLRAWTRQLTEQIRYTHGPEWGHKATSPNAPPSKESIARKVGDDLHVWDMLIGAATGQPILSTDPHHYHVNDQHFIPVEPVDHLASRGPPVARAPIPQPWIGLTSFDLGVRLEAGDRRWVDLMVAEGFTVARVVVASRYRTPRTLEDGLRQLPLTLATLAGAGLRAEVVVLVDTGLYEMTRATMRDYLRRVVAICEQHPDAIAGIEIANESTHSTQVEDLSDPAFLAELSALVPARFPVSWGSSHGGEPPFIGGGSYLTHHAARSESPEVNAAIMAQAQRMSGQPIIDDEALGIAEVERYGARTADPAYGERQARAARQYGLGGVTLHLEAGLTANVDLLGPIQREAIRRFVAAMVVGYFAPNQG